MNILFLILHVTKTYGRKHVNFHCLAVMVIAQYERSKDKTRIRHVLMHKILSYAIIFQHYYGPIIIEIIIIIR